jgi:hypothetical protein
MNPQTEEGSHEVIVVAFSSFLHVSVNRFRQDAPSVPTAVKPGQQSSGGWGETGGRAYARNSLCLNQT